MSKVYETTIIVKPDLGNDQVKDLLNSINNFFSENNVSVGYQEDWGIKNLKFNISKYSKGSFKFMRFESETPRLNRSLPFSSTLVSPYIPRSPPNILGCPPTF